MKGKYVDALFTLGMARLMNKQVDLAKKAFNTAMTIDDAQARIQDGLGQCHLALSEYAEAEDCFNEAIDNDFELSKSSIGAPVGEDGKTIGRYNVAFLQHRARCFNA